MMSFPRLVILESPYAGDVARNTAYARRAMADSLSRGEAPMVSHLLYTQVLDDTDPPQRARGIAAGLAWGRAAEATVVYCDLGFSPGMEEGIRRAQEEGRVVEERWIGKTPLCRPPQEEEWISWRGGRWATNGHVLLPESIAVAALLEGWRMGVTGEGLSRLVDGEEFPFPLRLVPWPVGADVEIRSTVGCFLRKDGEYVGLAWRYAHLFDGADFEQVEDPRRIVRARRDGEVVGYLMPISSQGKNGAPR